MKELHSGDQARPCQICEFKAKSETQLKKHMLVRHSKESKLCWFWSNAVCRNQNCEFNHPTTQSYRQNNYAKNIPCKFQNDCLYQRCQFLHFETSNKPACHFQNNCLNANCPFEHFGNHFLGRRTQNRAPPTLKPRMWRPWQRNHKTKTQVKIK